jgi:protein-tyrosine phosphatase
MIDIHSHLIYGVDDGSYCLDESIRMIKAAAKLGIDKIIATPHYQKKLYENTAVNDRYTTLTAKAAEFQIELQLGSELYANEELIAYIRKKSRKSKQIAKYLMMEIPLNYTLEETKRILNRIRKYQVKIVIAHPERNIILMDQMRPFIEYVKSSEILLQTDAGSIAGIYGHKVKEYTKKLIGLGMVNFIASNAHNSNDYSKVFSKAVEIIYKWCGTQEANMLLKNNASRISSIKPLTHYKIM